MANVLQRRDSLTPGAAYFFQQELEHIFPEVLEADIPARNIFSALPLGTSIPVGARTYTQKMQEYLGQARIIADGASDFPLVGVAREQETMQIRRVGDKYKYDYGDIEAQALTGAPLDRDRAMAARIAIEQLHNTVGFFGDADYGLYGLLNYPTIPRTAQTYGLDGTATVAQVIGQLSDLYGSISALTKGLVKPTVLAVTPAAYTYLMLTDRGANNDTTIGEFIETKFKVKIVDWHELEGAGDNGEDLCMFYTPNQLSGRYEVPGGRVFQQEAADKVPETLTWVVLCHGLTGGAHIPKPLEFAIGVLP